MALHPDQKVHVLVGLTYPGISFVFESDIVLVGLKSELFAPSSSVLPSV